MEPESSHASNRWGGLIDLQPLQLAQIAFVGIVTGLIVWLLTLVIRQAIFVPLFCGDPASSGCVGANTNAGIIAGLIGSVVGLMGLVRMSVFRPLLIVIAVQIVLWGQGGWRAAVPWYQGAVWSITLYALLFATFAWLVRPRIFGIALGVVTLVIILSRWLAML